MGSEHDEGRHCLEVARKIVAGSVSPYVVRDVIARERADARRAGMLEAARLADEMGSIDAAARIRAAAGGSDG